MFIANDCFENKTAHVGTIRINLGGVAYKFTQLSCLNSMAIYLHEILFDLMIQTTNKTSFFQHIRRKISYLLMSTLQNKISFHKFSATEYMVK